MRREKLFEVRNRIDGGVGVFNDDSVAFKELVGFMTCITEKVRSLEGLSKKKIQRKASRVL